jgi:hypothetical protein
MERYVALETELDQIRVCGLDASDDRDHFNILEREYVEIGAWLDGYYGEQDAMDGPYAIPSLIGKLAVSFAVVISVSFAFGFYVASAIAARMVSQ